MSDAAMAHRRSDGLSRRAIAGAALLAAGVFFTPRAVATQPQQIRIVREPLVVDIRLSEQAALEGATPDVRERVVEVLRAAATSHPGRLIALRLVGAPFRYAALSAREGVDAADRAAERYEGALSDLFVEAITALREAGVGRVSVVDMPLETGVGLFDMRDQTNDRYAGTLAELDAFVTMRSFIISESKDEATVVRRAMPQTFAVAEGRPILFRANRTWRAIIDVDASDESEWADDLLPEDAREDMLKENEHPRSIRAQTIAPSIGDDPMSGMAAAYAARNEAPGGSGSSGSGSGGGGGGSGSGGGGGGSGSGGGGGGSGSGGGGGGEGDDGDNGDGGGGGNEDGGNEDGENEDGENEDGENEDGEDEDGEHNGRLFPLTTIMIDPPEVRARYSDWGLQRSLIMPQWAIDPDATGYWTHPERTEYWIDGHCPDGYDGLIAIDWEHGVTVPLLEGVEHPRFAQVVEAFTRVAAYVKEQRPDAQVGYYRLPLSRRYDQNDTWYEASRAMQPVWDLVDVLMPSIYLHLQDYDFEIEKLSEVVRFSMELADGKPVYVYSWHRFHPIYDWGFSLIPDAVYERHVGSLLAVRYQGAKPAGAIAWGATDWYYEKAFAKDDEDDWINRGARWDRCRAAFDLEMNAGETIDEYIGRAHPRVYRNLARAADMN